MVDEDLEDLEDEWIIERIQVLKDVLDMDGFDLSDGSEKVIRKTIDMCEEELKRRGYSVP